MRKLMISCAFVLGAFCLSAFASQDDDKGRKKERAKVECCCEVCDCKKCTCHTDCSECKGCRHHEYCRECEDCHHEGYCCGDYDRHRHGDGHHGRHHRRGGCCHR